MKNFLEALVARFVRDDEGATAVEYGVMVAAIVAVIIAAVIAVGTSTNQAFTDTCDGLAQTSAGCTIGD